MRLICGYQYSQSLMYNDSTHNALNVNSVLIYNLQKMLKVGIAILHKTVLNVSMSNTVKHCTLRVECRYIILVPETVLW